MWVASPDAKRLNNGPNNEPRFQVNERDLTMNRDSKISHRKVSYGLN